ncbi:CHAP domain-containing protein [Nonomuraea sp. CA-218870]|uniref:CHAP domain-containing protein n=1 Tax=Nonomuraea sp. CA-218870 TaxID=3239998 RepID=UPI003D8D6515
MADKLLKTVQKELGYREKNGQHTKFGHWYAERVDDPQYKNAPWCDMFLAWAADKAGLTEYVGQFAWTPSHAVWFIEQDAWTRKPEPGALVFFDWKGGESYKGIDHVGVVERVVGEKIHTIEANVDRVWLKRKVRDTDKVVGYGLPRLVKANAERIEIRETEQPFPLRERADKAGSNPLDVIGTPVALLLIMVVTTVVVAFRLAGRRRVRPRPWNAPSAQPEIERSGPQYVMRDQVPPQPGPPSRESVPVGAPRRRRPYDRES